MENASRRMLSAPTKAVVLSLSRSLGKGTILPPCPLWGGGKLRWRTVLKPFQRGQTYSNATLGFTYQLPQDFFVNPLPVHLPPGSLLLVIADKGTPWRDRILLITDDADKYSWTTSEYVSHFVRSMPAEQHIVMLRETYLLKIAGQDFFRADFQKTDEGKTVYQAFMATRLKGCCQLDVH